MNFRFQRFQILNEIWNLWTKLNDKKQLDEAIQLINKGLALNARMDWANDCKTDALNKLKD